MKPRRNRFRLLPAGAGLVLAGCLIWSWCVVRPGVNLPAGSLTAARRMPSEKNRDESRPAELEAGRRKTPGIRRSWAAAPVGLRGLFDRHAMESVGDPGALRIRRREVELVATRDLPFRLQLIGHFGEGKNLSGIFEAEGASSPLIARSGDDLAELGLAVRSLEPEADEAPGKNASGFVARIWDRRTDREVVLAESVRVPSGIGAALLAPAGYPGEAIELLAGEIVEVGDSEFLVERIGLAPASARLRRLAAAVPNDDDDELFLQVEENPES